jgi:hypothetical protein
VRSARGQGSCTRLACFGCWVGEVLVASFELGAGEDEAELVGGAVVDDSSEFFELGARRVRRLPMTRSPSTWEVRARASPTLRSGGESMSTSSSLVLSSSRTCPIPSRRLASSVCVVAAFRTAGCEGCLWLREFGAWRRTPLGRSSVIALRRSPCSAVRP